MLSDAQVEVFIKDYPATYRILYRNIATLHPNLRDDQELLETVRAMSLAEGDNDIGALLDLAKDLRSRVKELKTRSVQDDGSLLTVGVRLLITEVTQSYLPEGYNWLGSAPVVKGLMTNGDVVVGQIGYPQSFVIDGDKAREMRRAYLGK